MVRKTVRETPVLQQLIIHQDDNKSLIAVTIYNAVQQNGH